MGACKQVFYFKIAKDEAHNVIRKASKVERHDKHSSFRVMRAVFVRYR